MAEKGRIVSLVLEMKNGKEEAFSKLYEVYYQDIYYYILRIVNDSELASDLTQETFIEIYQNVARLKEPEAFMKWSKTIAYHKSAGHFRKKREVLLEENEDDVSVFDTIVDEREEFIPDEALDQDELKKTIQQMIDSLPEEQRAAIMMRYFDELSVQDIADIQSVSEGTVKSRLNYGRKAIKNAVEEYEKKTGVKLHSVGVLPLLLWVFQGYWKSAQPTKAGAKDARDRAKKRASKGPKHSAKKVAKNVAKVGAKKGATSLGMKLFIVAVSATVIVSGTVGGTQVKPLINKAIEKIQIPEGVEDEKDETVNRVAYGTVFGETLVLSAQPIEEYEGVTASVESRLFPFLLDEDFEVKNRLHGQSSLMSLNLMICRFGLRVI